jgi:hypothetical protein
MFSSHVHTSIGGGFTALHRQPARINKAAKRFPDVTKKNLEFLHSQEYSSSTLERGKLFHGLPRFSQFAGMPPGCATESSTLLTHQRPGCNFSREDVRKYGVKTVADAEI